MRSAFLRAVRLILAGGLLLPLAEAQADCFWCVPHHKTCFPYNSPTFGYTPTTWRSWPVAAPEAAVAPPALLPPDVAPVLPVPRSQPMPDRAPEERKLLHPHGAGLPNSQVGPQSSDDRATEVLPPPPALWRAAQNEVAPSPNGSR